MSIFGKSHREIEEERRAEEVRQLLDAHRRAVQHLQRVISNIRNVGIEVDKSLGQTNDKHTSTLPE